MISFVPPLNETTILNVPFHPGDLTFTATLSAGPLDPRSTIQIWSDIPDNSQPSISSGQQAWTARPFAFQNDSSVASLSIPFQDLNHSSRSQFSFTYRILHPDDRIEWLGEYGKNGSLIVNKYDDRLVFLGDWSHNSHIHSFAPKSSIKSPLLVSSLSDKVQWRCWDLSNGSPSLLSVDHGPARIHSALLLPSQPKAAIIPLSPILLTSKDVQVTIHLNARSVHITSPSPGGLLSLQTLSPDSLISSLTDALPSLVSIPNPDSHHALLLANPHRGPTRLFAIPLSADSSASAPLTLSLPLLPILLHLQFLSDTATHFFISKPPRFIPTSAKQIQLTIPNFAGAQFSLLPVYDLFRYDGDVHFSLIAKYKRIATPPIHNLLTPPPSPPMNATENETEAQPLNSVQENQVPSVHTHHVDDQPPQPIDPAVQEQLASGQSTPKPRTAAGTNSIGLTPSIDRHLQRGVIRKLVCFVLRILLFYTRILFKFVLTIFARPLAIHVPKQEPVATPKAGTTEVDEDQTEVTKATPVSSAVHLAPECQHSGSSTPRNDPVYSATQKVSGVVETLEALASRTIPEFSTKDGEEEKARVDSGVSQVQEPNPKSDVKNKKSGRDGEWTAVRPGVVFELTALPPPSPAVEGEAPPKIKPPRFTLGGEACLVKQVKFYLDDVELTGLNFEPLAGTEQDELWTVEIPRASRELMTLKVL